MAIAKTLAGRTLLLLEDEALVALDVTEVFEEAGARVLLARTPAQARCLTDQTVFSAAILDCGFEQDEHAALCCHLSELGIPFMFYTGYDDVHVVHPEAMVVTKPANAQVL